MPVGRFAPTPSGPLHFGSVVAAVGSCLDARAAGGKWLLRIDDVDRPRAVRGAGAAILASLERLGFTWDAPPVWQHDCEPHYAAALAMLADKGLVYGCACTRKMLADAPRAVWTISRYVENGRTLRQLKEDLQPSRRSPQHAVIERLFADGMRLMRRIHDAGFEHRDYHAGNLLVTTGDDGSHNLQLVDLETVMQRRATTLRRARDVRRFLENFVEPDDYREVIDRALELYAPDEPAMRAGILGTRRMQGLLKKRGERWDG